jgi:hypothetical protein
MIVNGPTSEFDNRQRKRDEYEQYKARHARYQSSQYPDYSHGVSFPKSGYEFVPPLDIEKSMRRLTLNVPPSEVSERAHDHSPTIILHPMLIPASNQETAAAQRQYERGRKISGGALGLSGSNGQQGQQESYMNQRQSGQQEAYMNPRQAERSRSRHSSDRARPISGEFGGRQLYMSTGGSNIAGMNPESMDSPQPGVVPHPQSPYVNPNTIAGENKPTNISQYTDTEQTPVDGDYVAFQPQPSPIAFPGQLPPAGFAGAVPVVTSSGIQTMGIPIGYVDQLPPEIRNQIQQGQFISPIDPTSFLGTPINPYAKPVTHAREKTNVTGVMDTLHQQVRPYGYVIPADKTLITPGPPPKQLHTTNTNDSLLQSQPQQVPPQPQPQLVVQPQPNIQNEPGAHSESNRPPFDHRPSSHYLLPPDTPGSSHSSPRALDKYQPSEYMQVRVSTSPNFNSNDSVGDLSKNTGSTGFGVRRPHVRASAYKGSVRDLSPEIAQSRLPKVSLRPPRSNLRAPNFLPQVITYDLNNEHRQENPLPFRRFVSDRDVQHDEWDAFKEVT